MTKARVNADNASADIQGVTAGTGLTGGGTTGTVTLTNGMATAIDAKGDLVVGTGADTFSRLAAGSNGDTIVADSSTATGLRYTGGTVQSNPVLNSAMQIWQRGTSITPTTTSYSADRWFAYRGVGGATVSRQVTNDTTNLPFIQYCARVARNSGDTSTVVFALSQSFESINSIAYAGRTVTFSFYARAGANYSATGNALQAALGSGTGTDQNLTLGFTGYTAVATPSATLTTTWQRFSATGTVPTNSNQLGVFFQHNPTGTAGANDWFEVTGVQVDIGSVALPFRTYAGTIQGELAACRYYYRRNVATGNAYGGVLAPTVIANATTAAVAYWQEAPMRAIPTSVEFANIAFADTVSVYAITAIVLNGSNTLAIPTLTVTSSGLTQYRNYSIVGNNNAAGYIAISAEL